MSINVRLDRVMADRRVSLTDLAERVGITNANLSILKNNKAKAIRLSTLEAICRELQCQPGELLEYVPDGGAASTRESTAAGDSGESGGSEQV